MQNMIDAEWLRLLKDVIEYGEKISPRGQNTHELIGLQSRIDMKYPILQVGGRKLGRKFQAAEAAWILDGDNRVASIEPYSKEISKFSDDGKFYFGAYGPKIREQLPYLIKILSSDPDSRQAVLNIWRESPMKSKDIPCTLSVQFLIRNNTLHCINTMRSSDLWLGWPYDVFNFSMLSSYLILIFRDLMDWNLELGSLALTAGSGHLYERNWEDAIHIIDEHDGTFSAPKAFEPLEFFDNADHMVDVLWELAEGKGSLELINEQD